MKKLSKKLLALLLVFAMLIPTGSLMVTTSAVEDNAVGIPGYVQNTSGEKAKGTCTDTISWTLYNDGELVIVGTGKMPDWSYHQLTPWYPYHTFTRKVTIGNGITHIGVGAFENTENLEIAIIPKTVVSKSGVAFWYCYNLKTVFYTGTEEEWNKIKTIGFEDTELNAAELICEWKFEEDVQGEHFPDGYNFETDRWNFKNIKETIALDYYIGMYEEQKGTELYNFRGKTAAHGHCFGMATSTAATLINIPYVTDYISWTGIPYTKLSSVNQGTMNIDMDISAKDYIKYCYIYQDSAFVASQRNSDSHNGIQNVYNAVKNAALTNTDCTLIVIDFWGGSGGHAVYAAGIDGNDILVNDSNVPGSLQRIKINGDNWTYSAAGFYWDSSVDATIDYVENCTEPYFRLVWNIDVPGAIVPENNQTANLYTEESELNGTNSYFSSYIEPIDTDKLLVVSENDSFSFSESEKMYAIKNTDGDNSENSDGLYWLDSGDTINAENISDESAILKLVGNELKITAEMPVDSSAEMTVNENGDNKAVFDVEADDEFSITFTTLDDDKQFVETTLTGTANGDEVVASETENGIQVTGLNDITVTYETPDGTAETKADVTDGSTVNITVNDDENKVETDWQDKEETETDEECKHSDANHDGICDACSEDFTKGCSCNCHGNAFMQFLHKIVSFLRKLFGMTQYQYCNCGKAHW